MKGELTRFYEALKSVMAEQGKLVPEHRERYLRMIATRAGIPIDRVEGLALRLQRCVRDAETDPVLRLVAASEAKRG